jgi:hypothetical protein
MGKMAKRSKKPTKGNKRKPSTVSGGKPPLGKKPDTSVRDALSKWRWQEDTLKDIEVAADTDPLRALQRRTKHLAQLERDKDSLLESYADLLPEAIDALGSEERHRVYRMMGMEVHLAPDGSFELSGDVLNFSELGISSA